MFLHEVIVVSSFPRKGNPSRKAACTFGFRLHPDNHIQLNLFFIGITANRLVEFVLHGACHIAAEYNHTVGIEIRIVVQLLDKRQQIGGSKTLVKQIQPFFAQIRRITAQPHRLNRRGQCRPVIQRPGGQKRLQLFFA